MRVFSTLPKVAPNTRLKKHYKTLIILLVAAKYPEIMIFRQLDLKRILKNQKSEGEAHFCMVNLRLARGISRIPLIFFLEFGHLFGAYRLFADNPWGP